MDDVRWLGGVGVRPPLNPTEYEYLTAFAESRRWRRPGGPYAVPDHPLLECTSPGLDLVAYSTVADGQPGLVCPWTPARAGTVLVAGPWPTGGGGADFAAAVAWLTYLAAHFLGPGARVVGRPGFEQFTGGHVLDGTLAAQCSTTGRLRLVTVSDSQVEVRGAYAGVPDTAVHRCAS